MLSHGPWRFRWRQSCRDGLCHACTEGSPLFHVTWYGLAMGGVMLATTLIGSRILRW